MKTSEKMKRAFVRPKVMFKRKELKLTKKGKVFGLTLANGKQLLCHQESAFEVAANVGNAGAATTAVRVHRVGAGDSHRGGVRGDRDEVEFEL